MQQYQPQDVGIYNPTATTVKFIWSIDESVKSKIYRFNIHYRPFGEVEWNKAFTKDNTNSWKITKLKSETMYEIKLRSVLPDGDESRFSDIIKFKTTVSLSEKMKQISTKLPGGDSPSIFKIPLIELQKQTSIQTKKCRLKIDEEYPEYTEMTIMVVGKSGSGKSTLINGLSNFLFDVSWDERVRFKLIDTATRDEENPMQADSQTEWITCYQLPWMPGSRVKSNLRIIDTPGFGDTRGPERDKELMKHIEAFFKAENDQGIDVLDAVWFVIQAPNDRLDILQRYIYDSILSIFGKDIEDNIFLFITFADGPNPPVFAAIKAANIPHRGKYIFNNSVLFADSDNTADCLPIWKMGKQGFEKFFDDFIEKKIKQKSLSETKEVLITRQELEHKISKIQDHIVEVTEMQAALRHEEKVVEQFRDDMTHNKNFTHKEWVPKVVHIELPIGIHTNTCVQCNHICHKNCIVADDKIMKCMVMRPQGDANAHCVECEGKCIWSKHKNYPYLIEVRQVEEERTSYLMKEKYEVAREGLHKSNAIKEKIRQKYDKAMEKNTELVYDIKHCINHLKDIALKPNPISEVDYIDLLITNENENRSEDYEERVSVLKQLRQKAEIRQTLVVEPEIENYPPSR